MSEKEKMAFQMNLREMVIVGLCFFAISSESIRAASVIIPASANATLLGGTDASTNQSLADPGMFVGTDGQGNAKRGLIQFNIVGAIPAGATITGAQLQLTVGQVAGSGGGGNVGLGNGNTIGLFDETQPWGQPTNVVGATSFGAKAHGAPPANGDATWNNAFYNSNSASATPWSIVGGNWMSTSLDIADTAVTASAGSSSTWSSALMVSDVQNWLNNPSTNFGWLLKNQDEVDSTDFRAFWGWQGAANNGAPLTAPALTVTYTPEPVGLSLIAAAVPILLGHRRRRAPAQFN